jgi:riboflavin kinase / FMN adenylyltransferase
MDVLRGTESFAATRRLREPVVAIGNFDGVHRGHQRLLEEARTRARARGGDAVVLTFEPHPARVLAPRLAPPLLCTPARKRELIADAGIDVLVLEPFTPALAALPPEEFVARVLVGHLGARELVVGYDFTYGAQRRGTASTLRAEGAARDIDVVVVPQVTVHGLAASSTKIREFLLEGNVAGARLLLGRDFDVDGEVVAGAGRGRGIGVPTANVRPESELLPRPGVYAVRARVDGGAWLDGAANLGTNPTFGGGALSLEVHLLGFSGDLLGRRLRVAFRARLRSEERFASVEELVAQIRRDIDEARRLLAQSPSPSEDDNHE